MFGRSVTNPAPRARARARLPRLLRAGPKSFVVINKFRQMLWCWTFFLLTMEVFFGDILGSVHWEVICSLKRKEIRDENRSIRRITDKLILKKIT